MRSGHHILYVAKKGEATILRGFYAELFPRVDLVGACNRRQSRAMPWGRTLSQRRFTLRRSVTAEKAHLAGLVRFLAIHVNFPPFSPLMFELVKRCGPQKSTGTFFLPTSACAIAFTYISVTSETPWHYCGEALLKWLNEVWPKSQW